MIQARIASDRIIRQAEVNSDTDWKGDRKIGAVNRTERLGGLGAYPDARVKKKISASSRAAVLRWAADTMKGYPNG